MPDAANDNVVSEHTSRASVQRPKSRPCPICGRPVGPEAPPFCSKRCADVDLHRWLGGSYAIPVESEESTMDAVQNGSANGDD